MPAYEYKCLTCDNTLTIVRGIDQDETKPICIKCAEEMGREYDYAFGVSFKGTGWGKD